MKKKGPRRGPPLGPRLRGDDGFAAYCDSRPTFFTITAYFCSSLEEQAAKAPTVDLEKLLDELDRAFEEFVEVIQAR